MDRPIPIPRWLVKGKTVELPDGNIVTFAGENPRDYCIIVKDKNEKVHANFVIKPDEFELHTKNEVTEERSSLFELYYSVIIDLTKYWSDKRREFINIFPSKYWKNHDELVVEVNSSEIPAFRWREGVYNVEPEELVDHIIPKSSVIKLKFSIGVLFDKSGNSLGMLMPVRKTKRLLLIKKPLFEIIMNTVIGMNWLRKSLKEDHEKMKAEA